MAGVSARIEATEKLYNDAELGASSETVIRAMEPLMEKRLAVLLDQFMLVPPELGPMLDLRAKISEVWRIRKELKQARDKGRNSWEALQVILEAEAKSNSKE